MDKRFSNLVILLVIIIAAALVYISLPYAGEISNFVSMKKPISQGFLQVENAFSSNSLTASDFRDLSEINIVDGNVFYKRGSLQSIKNAKNSLIDLNSHLSSYSPSDAKVLSDLIDVYLSVINYYGYELILAREKQSVDAFFLASDSCANFEGVKKVNGIILNLELAKTDMELRGGIFNALYSPSISEKDMNSFANFNFDTSEEDDALTLWHNMFSDINSICTEGSK